MSNPLVSAVITTFNYGAFVVDAVRSVLAQDYPNMEVIVVDDGSTDDTRRRLAPLMDRIRYIYQQNGGCSAARNTGITEARGQWIGLLDADDQWHPQRISRQIRYAAAHPDHPFVASDTITDLSNGWPTLPAESPVRLVNIEHLVISARFAPSSVLIRRDCLVDVGLFRTELRCAEDRDMWIRLAAHHPVAIIDLPLMFYRNHGTNISTGARRMDLSDRAMLGYAFAEIPQLRRRRLLRRKAFSSAASMSSYLYTAAGDQRAALARIIESLVLWPFAYERGHHKTPARRWKMLAVILLRALHLKEPHGGYPLAANQKAYG